MHVLAASSWSPLPYPSSSSDGFCSFRNSCPLSISKDLVLNGVFQALLLPVQSATCSPIACLLVSLLLPKCYSRPCRMPEPSGYIKHFRASGTGFPSSRSSNRSFMPSPLQACCLYPLRLHPTLDEPILASSCITPPNAAVTVQILAIGARCQHWWIRCMTHEGSTT